MRRMVLAALVLLPAAAGAQEGPSESADVADAAAVTDTVEAAGAADAAAAAEAEEPAPDRWGFEVNLALTSATGNEQITVLVTDGKITHLQTKSLKLDLSGRVRYGRSDGEAVAQNTRTSLTLELVPDARWSPFVSGRAEKDPFRKLDLRTSSGAGVRYRVLRRDAVELTVSGAALHSYENLEMPPADLATDRTHAARWRWIARGRAQLRKNVEAQHESYYEPVWDHATDYLMEVQNTLRFRFTDGLSFRIVHVFERDSSPAEDVRENDMALTVGVSYATKF